MKSELNLDTNKYLSDCDARDIISCDSKDPIYLSKLYSLIKASFTESIIRSISGNIIQKLENKCNAKLWFEDGEKCEILKAGSKGWQTGKLKLKINLSLEFIPDEIEEVKSPLDDIRQADLNNSL